jgi:hypothetical protein
LIEHKYSLKRAFAKHETSLAKTLEEQTIAIAQILNRMEVVLMDNTQTTIVDAFQLSKNIMSIDKNNQVSRDHNAELREVRREEEQIRLSVANKILESLEFATMSDRLQEVAPAHATTYEWIFEDEWKWKTPWSNFVKWLRYDNEKGNGIYWINGKAGSGKSTLMRYIYLSERTKELLDLWAKPLRPTIAAFFFWNSGTVEQRSHSGLLRALLFDVLCQRRDLIPVVFPWLWAREYSRFKTGADSQLSFEQPLQQGREDLSLPRLKDAFQNLITQSVVPMKLCLFIDGLDEYEGNHEEITEVFRKTASCQHIKICLSSRPLLVFDDAFKNCPSLCLQDLSFDDIKNYVSERLGKHPRYVKLLEKEPMQGPALVEEIVEKANGVFLWVKLVVKSLLAGLGNRDSITDLQRRLRELPSDLEKLYQQMLILIDPFYLRSASELFQIVRAATEDPSGPLKASAEPLTVLALSFADEEGYDFAINASIRRLDEEEASSRCQLMADRLKCRCAGLLEIQETETSMLFSGIRTVHKIQYLHRTVKDYLHQPDTWSILLSHTAGTPFSPHTALLKSCILQLKHLDSAQRFDSLWRIASTAMYHARYSDSEESAPLEALLDELDNTVAFHGNKINNGYERPLGRAQPNSSMEEFIPFANSPIWTLQLPRHETEPRQQPTTA